MRPSPGLSLTFSPPVLTHRISHLRVIDMHIGGFFEQIAAHKRRRRLAGVARVLLEREAKHADFLGGDGVEHAGHHDFGKAALLVLVHQDHLVPVVRALLQAQRLANVHQVQNVLLEARADKKRKRRKQREKKRRNGCVRKR